MKCFYMGQYPNNALNMFNRQIDYRQNTFTIFHYLNEIHKKDVTKILIISLSVCWKPSRFRQE